MAQRSQYVAQLGQLLLGHLPLLLRVPVQVQEVVLPVQAPQAHGPLCSAQDKVRATSTGTGSPSSSAGQPGSCVTCNPGSAPESRASPSPELQRERLGRRPHSAGESLGTGEENHCHQPHKGRAQGIFQQPRRDWWRDHRAPLLTGSQSGTTCLAFCPPRLRLWPITRPPGPSWGRAQKPQSQTSSLRGRPLQESCGILLWHCEERPSIGVKVLLPPQGLWCPSLTDLTQELLGHLHSEGLRSKGKA